MNEMKEMGKEYFFAALRLGVIFPFTRKAAKFGL
jgi:hypothetical protein